MFIAQDWKDYEVIDTGNGEKLERWGGIMLRRPDPLAIWPIQDQHGLWKQAAAWYHRSSSGGGYWEYTRKLPDRWTIHYEELAFHVKPTGFKHTGLFPEQAVNWRWIMDKIRQADRPIRVLNLFAYTEARPWQPLLEELRKSFMSMRQKASSNGPRRTLRCRD